MQTVRMLLLLIPLLTPGCIINEAWRTSKDSTLQTVEVRFTDIKQSDSWILDCKVYFSPIVGVRSGSSYAILTIVPGPVVSAASPKLEEQVFELSGFKKDIAKDVHFKCDEWQARPGAPIHIVLDFLVNAPTQNPFEEHPTLSSIK